MKKVLMYFAAIFTVVTAFEQVHKDTFVVPHNWPKPAFDFKKQPLISAQVLLGRVLFYDPLLSRNNTVSCASCHSQYTAFTHVDHALSHGIDDRIGTRNSPALMNLAWSTSFMWDGSMPSLQQQVFSPITHPQEMDEHLLRLTGKLQHSSLYSELFYNAFQDSAITAQRIAIALEQFMLTLVSAQSKYDRVMAKQEIFTPQEQKGYLLFRKDCASCHTEPLFTNHRFEQNTLAPDTLLNDSGRSRVTHRKEDAFKFKVPTLRNIEFSYPYMHDGRFTTLSEVLNHYSVSFQSAIQPINITSKDKVDLMAFLLTLTDRKFLFDTNHAFPRHILLTQ